MSASPAILFGNEFLSYLLVFVVFVVVIGIAVAVGIIIAKKRNEAKLAAEAAAVVDEELPFTAENGESAQ